MHDRQQDTMTAKKTTRKKAAYKGAGGAFGNRGTNWPPGAWRDLAEAYGGATKLAEELGVGYQTVYRWAMGVHPVPAVARLPIAMLAAKKGLPSPAVDPK